jgi:hypothetical protein
VEFLQGNASKAKKKLKWEPKVKFKELVKIMVDADMEAAGLKPIGEGLKILDRHFGDWHRWSSGVTAVIRSAGNGTVDLSGGHILPRFEEGCTCLSLPGGEDEVRPLDTFDDRDQAGRHVG